MKSMALLSPIALFNIENRSSTITSSEIGFILAKFIGVLIKRESPVREIKVRDTSKCRDGLESYQNSPLEHIERGLQYQKKKRIKEEERDRQHRWRTKKSKMLSLYQEKGDNYTSSSLSQKMVRITPGSGIQEDTKFEKHQSFVEGRKEMDDGNTFFLIFYHLLGLQKKLHILGLPSAIQISHYLSS